MLAYGLERVDASRFILQVQIEARLLAADIATIKEKFGVLV